ncbi:bifunctional diaminohydroxyphosphoribosylaminopyrimidine deaminase/5-amino-6-(5-phosphoribosylamino)uracil reductase RibD [Erythrobacter litoralis]|uniref:bifunctional diaminohydroxyphosphoribosylaminopyrimidine deaminase/5-amino-6-(5-phosphoribosylamino)uracil reductase RibD n=1 Tax=Erythrobacter litoralis TaxID=39960 RepID=UPI002434B09D|nr:bifunctional diaminohydroxyphosphoribosylaminopyrimidine deaminase/5-amino-6-(5-phosphoribosylamino)uracil reductase RibD [Erythrobacter litoralis]
MAAAARLASRGRPMSAPNPAVGCIIVRDGIVVGRGWTQPGGRPHAEAVALGEAGERARGAVVYVTLEPCAHRSERGPACADLLIDVGVAAVAIGTQDPDPRTAGKGVARLRDHGIEVELADHPSCRESLAGYLIRAERGRPFVTLKLAISLDGNVAMMDGSSQWITGTEARAHVHSRRAMHDAILVGGGTWRDDKPRLDVRLPGLSDRSPIRIVLTRSTLGDDVSVITDPEEIVALENVQYLYVEGGAHAAASFLKADFVDRLEFYRAPIVIGSAKTAVADLGLASLEDAHGRWRLAEQRRLGSDLFEAYTRTR